MYHRFLSVFKFFRKFFGNLDKYFQIKYYLTNISYLLRYCMKKSQYFINKNVYIEKKNHISVKLITSSLCSESKDLPNHDNLKGQKTTAYFITSQLTTDIHCRKEQDFGLISCLQTKQKIKIKKEKNI